MQKRRRLRSGYIKCAFNNVFTAMGFLLLGFAGLTIFLGARGQFTGALDDLNTLAAGLFSFFGLCLNFMTKFGFETYEMYQRILRLAGSGRYAEIQIIQPRVYCTRVGYNLALKELGLK